MVIQFMQRRARSPLRYILLAMAAVCFSPAVNAIPVSAIDDIGKKITLASPAQRIISLTPHITELLFAAGAGTRIAGAAEYSDYPAAAQKIPRIGSHQRLDLERIASLRPDLVVAWQQGGERQTEQIRRLGLPIFMSESRSLADIAPAIEALGALAGTGAEAGRAAAAFRTRLQQLQQLHAGKPPVRVFFQIWSAPVMTVNGQHLISEALRTCGGVNVFAALPQLAPAIDTEAVLAANPDIIIASADDAARPPWLDGWNAWPRLNAVRDEQLVSVASGIITRHSPRILDGIEKICRQLDAARAARGRHTGTK